MRAFIDTNVIVDVVAKREPFFADSQAILALCAMGEINVRHFNLLRYAGGRFDFVPYLQIRCVICFYTLSAKNTMRSAVDGATRL